MARLAPGLALSLCLLLLAPVAVAQGQPPLAGPAGASASKVLVIGTDGTRIDLLERVVASGRAPHFKALAEDGFAVPSLLAYQPPEAATISEVGWASIATGVWPAKHGVRGYFLNNDPGQSTKNGYPDFLSRIEGVRPALSTFLASNWSNIGLHKNGGPIFGDAIDARYAIDAPGTIDGWDRADEDVANVAVRYLREGNPDAGFVYLGIVDEVAHLAGSRTPRYRQAIEDTDRRIGAMLSAIRARPTYREERWAVIVTTDHGQQDLAGPSMLSHGFGSDLERTSFVAAAGHGLEAAPPFAEIGIVDVAPTVLARLGIPIDPAWNLDGQPFSTAPEVPDPRGSARLRGRLLSVDVTAPDGAPGLARVTLALPGRMTARSARSTPRSTVAVRRGGRTVDVRPHTPGARRVRTKIRIRPIPRRSPVRVSITGTDGAMTTLRVLPK